MKINSYTGFYPAKILIPSVTDLTSFSCVACDQFTGNPEYWKELDEKTKGKKRALDLILPEIYLNDNLDERIKKINSNIENYVKDNVLKELNEGYVLTVRSTPFKERRIGLIGAIDLEKYDYKKDVKPIIRATEGTIEERIPPRLKIREKAMAEFPHIMILIDDEKKEIIENLYENRNSYKKLYSFDLNMGGGKIEGYFIDDIKGVTEKFNGLLDKERLLSKYGKADEFALAVGDGNHSLATAKTHWNNVKKNLPVEEIETHPARYALAEIVNIYDEGIYFEPIYRFVTGVDKDKFVKGLKTVDGGEIKVIGLKDEIELKGKNFLADGIREVDSYIKEYLSKFGGEVDYIHGEDNLKNLVKGKENAVGIIFKKLDKKDLFKYVSNNGAFPRKTFSMGMGVEKRYYLEGKRITK